jgi:hypothetical protein
MDQQSEQEDRGEAGESEAIISLFESIKFNFESTYASHPLNVLLVAGSSNAACNQIHSPSLVDKVDYMA